MKTPLKIEDFREGLGVKCLKLTGFSTEEIDELTHCDYRDLKKRVVEIANERNNGIGTCWECGYGVYNAWTRGNEVFIEVGNSCD